MITLDKKTKEQLLDLLKNKGVGLEGNILKLIDSESDKDFKDYVDACIQKDKDNRRKRLEVTKKVQEQYTELLKSKEITDRVQKELEESLRTTTESMEEVKRAKEEAETAREQSELLRKEAEESKTIALNAKDEIENAKKKVEGDLDILQKKSQNELIGIIVRVSLFVIVGVAFVTTAVYLIAMFSGKDTQVVASTWSNIIGILLTNAFSIIGTIMGVKYATEDKKRD